MNAKSRLRPRKADRAVAEEEARKLSLAVASGDRAGAAEALTTLAQTLEGLRNRKSAEALDHQNEVPRESFDPARGLKPVRNPAFAAAHAAGVSRPSGKVWPRAMIGIAVAGAAVWWFAAHRPEPHPEPAAGIAQNIVPQSGAVLASNKSGREAAEADMLESEVMALAGQMSAPEVHATLVAPQAPVVAEKTPAPPQPNPKNLATPQDALATATPAATGFSAVAGLITQWRNEQAQLVSAEKKLTAGRTAEARQLIAAVQTQIVLQPVTPDAPRPAPGNNAAAAKLGRTLQLMDAGQQELALRTLRDAIQDLRSVFPAAGGSEAGAG
ncbi:MAG: hypothetical protein ACREFO_08115 [Acetobacteraceae bacterium]